MTLDVTPAADWSAAELAACFTDAFEGYLAGSFVMGAATLPHFLHRQGADLALSRCVVRDGALLGLAFVGEYAARRRIGGMGLRPEARGSGASRLLLQRVADETRDAGLRALELEVFVQNTPAVRLYRSFGFADGAALWGFERTPGAAAAAAKAPHEVAVDVAAEWLLAQNRDELPYQVSSHALRRFDAAAWRAWRLGDALLVWRETGADGVAIALLFDANAAQRDALHLLQALLAAFPQHTARVPPLMRDDVAARALREAGFSQLPLHQMQMRLVR